MPVRGGKDLPFPAFFPECVLEPLSYQETGRGIWFSETPRRRAVRQAELETGAAAPDRKLPAALAFPVLRLQAENKGRQAQ